MEAVEPAFEDLYLLLEVVGSQAIVGDDLDVFVAGVVLGEDVYFKFVHLYQFPQVGHIVLELLVLGEQVLDQILASAPALAPPNRLFLHLNIKWSAPGQQKQQGSANIPDGGRELMNNIINQHDELVGSCVLPCGRGSSRREEQLRLLPARGRLGDLHFEYPSPHPAVQQSPIDLTDALAQPASSFLFLHFYPQKATIVWLNTTVYIQAAPITLGLG